MVKETVKLTRVFVLEGDKKNRIHEQSITVRTSAVDTVRASNRLSKLAGTDPIDDQPAHRSTITMRSGAEIELAEKSGEVNLAVFGVRN